MTSEFRIFVPYTDPLNLQSMQISFITSLGISLLICSLLGVQVWVLVSLGNVFVKLTLICSRTSHKQSHSSNLKMHIAAING